MRFMKPLVTSLGLLTASFLLIGCGGNGDGGGAADTIQAGKFTILGTRTDNIDPSMAKANAENTLVRTKTAQRSEERRAVLVSNH